VPASKHRSPMPKGTRRDREHTGRIRPSTCRGASRRIGCRADTPALNHSGHDSSIHHNRDNSATRATNSSIHVQTPSIGVSILTFGRGDCAHRGLAFARIALAVTMVAFMRTAFARRLTLRNQLGSGLGKQHSLEANMYAVTRKATAHVLPRFVHFPQTSCNPRTATRAA
jgi:hypothetical protein